MKKYVLAYYDSEAGMEVNCFNTLQEAYDYMIRELEACYECLYDFPSLDELVESWNQGKIWGEWQSRDSYIRYVAKKRVYGYICDLETFTAFEIVPVR